MLRVCVLLVSMCIFGGGSLSGRGFFCRDPDTGKLHAVNTTWPSSSFCGNYNCKLRRKNLTETEYAPMRQINITHIKLFDDNITNENIKTEASITIKQEVEQNIINPEQKTAPDIKNDITIQDILPLERNITHNEKDKKIVFQNENERDRYLTDKEIRTISDILHTVKKSDLDAIVEIYNLAQDIYKEIDKTSTDQVLDETVYTAKTANNFNYKTKPDFSKFGKKGGRVSYWYEPLSNGKIRPADMIRAELPRPNIIRNDVIPIIPAEINKQGFSKVKFSVTTSRPITTPAPVKRPPPVKLPPPPPPDSKSRQISATYFNGPLSHKDFGKLPYYYPMSNFQRLSSYIHHQPKSKMPSGFLSSDKMPVAKAVFQPITYRPAIYNGGKYQKEIKPSILLPYPFSYIHHYNWSYPQNTYQNTDHLEQVMARKKDSNGLLKNYAESTKGNAVLMNPDLENFQDLEVKAIRKEDNLPSRNMAQKIKDENIRPDWQTDPLPNHILQEVRARIQDKQRLKPFPLRKKVKLERVGKLLQLDEITRVKRSPVQNSKTTEDESLQPELYEVYIERTTCNSDYNVPGYFRYGNLSQPFPECCPQRISNR